MRRNGLYFSWTMPSQEWLLGITYSPTATVENMDTNEVNEFQIFSIGFLLCRIDYFI